MNECFTGDDKQKPCKCGKPSRPRQRNCFDCASQANQEWRQRQKTEKQQLRSKILSDMAARAAAANEEAHDSNA